MQTAREVLIALTHRYAFGEVAALIAEGADGERLTTRQAAQVQRLCAFGQRLIDLDAEDFGLIDPTVNGNTESALAYLASRDDVPPQLLARALACRMPQSPGERHRGALGSLRPAYRLLLEVIAAHWRRRATTALVAAVHIASEYAALLAWEGVLGHAADPLKLGRAVDGPGSAWGDYGDSSCRHSKAERSAAQRALRVAEDGVSAWRRYLDRQHSHVAHALGVCAAECERPCTVLTRLAKEDEARVTEGSRLALAFVNTPIVRLRHSAPVGHGFGVPSPAEVLEAWAASQRELARIEPAVLTQDAYPLPGLPTLLGSIAGVCLTPDTLLADTATAVVALLEQP